MKTRRLYQDGIDEEIVGPIKDHVTSDGHTIRSYRLANGTRQFFATLSGTHWSAHGRSVAEAVADALWKDPARRPSMQALIESVKGDRNHKFTLNEFRLLTGACLTGCRSALIRAKRDESPMTAIEIRDVVSKEWGNKLLSVLGWEKS